MGFLVFIGIIYVLLSLLFTAPHLLIILLLAGLLIGYENR